MGGYEDEISSNLERVGDQTILAQRFALILEQIKLANTMLELSEVPK